MLQSFILAVSPNTKPTMQRLILLLFTTILLASCAEVKTTNPSVVYNYWTGVTPTKDVELINGEYWETAVTQEHFLFLKMKPTKKWWDKFVKNNKLAKDDGQWTKPEEAPSWFEPSNDMEVYKRTEDFNENSRFFRNPVTNECFIFESQL